MPDPSIAEVDERRLDGLAQSSDTHATLHCPPNVSNAPTSHQLTSDDESAASTNTLDRHFLSLQQAERLRNAIPNYRLAPPSISRSPHDIHFSRRTPHFLVPYHELESTDTQQTETDSPQASRCPFVADAVAERSGDGPSGGQQPFESSQSGIAAALVAMSSEDEIISNEVQRHTVDSTERNSLPTERSYPPNLFGDRGVDRIRLLQSSGNRSATPGPFAAAPRLRLGVQLPSEEPSHSQLSTPLDIRAPQSVNPGTPVIANDPVLEGSASPVSSEHPQHSLAPEKKPFGRYRPSFLYHGSVFKGTQQSDRQVYNVEVKIQHVNMDESFMCGFLKIEGLTEDHPTLETYFEGEIIGSKYTFTTRHPDWGATEKQDMLHWNRFTAWKPLARSARSPDFSYRNFAEREHIFMRWKEHFLVPDHNVKAISGASFEGFYYICFNQRTGSFSGIYYHSKSEKWQQLELKHEGHMGTMAAIELR